MLRVRRICTKDEDYLINALMLNSHFIRRGYPKHLNTKALKWALKLNRDDFLNKNHLTRSMPEDPDTSETFHYITTHNPVNPPIAEIIKRNWDIILWISLTSMLSFHFRDFRMFDFNLLGRPSNDLVKGDTLLSLV